jgi:tetratricopeptide (TPR) repeat protein
MLHVRIVEALEHLYAERLAEQVDHLAHHAVRGEVWDKALTYSQQAGAKAMTHSAHREAAECFEQALVALGQLPERRDTLEQAIDLRFDLRNALQPLNELTRIFDHLRAAEALAERLGDPQRLGRLASYLCFYFMVIDEHDRAMASGQRALALAATSGAFDVQVIAQNCLGIAYYAAGDYSQGLDCMRRVIALLPGDLCSARFGFPVLPAATAHGYMSWSLAELGDFVEGVSIGEDALRLAEAMAQPASIAFTLWCVGLVSRPQGDTHAAIPILEQALALSQTANILNFPVSASLLSAAYALVGRTAEAVPLLDQMLERVATWNPIFFHALVLAELSEALLLVGRVEEASALAEHLYELSRTHTGRGYQAHAYRLLGDIAIRREPPDVDQVTAYYCQGLAVAEELRMRPLQAHCHRGLGTVYATTGQRAQAHTELGIAIALYRAMDMTFWLPQTEAALAQVE